LDLHQGSGQVHLGPLHIFHSAQLIRT
jgi:hypothetical protein